MRPKTGVIIKEEKLSMSERQARKLRKAPAEDSAGHKKGKSSAGLNAIIALVIVVFLGLGAYAVTANFKAKAPTGDSSADSTATQTQTVSQYAEEQGMTAEDFLAQYGLDGSDVTADTDMNTAVSEMTVEKYAEFSGKTTDEVKDEYKLGKDVTADMKWSDAQGYIPIGKMLENSGMSYDDFLANYDLTSKDIPEDMKWNDAMPILQEAAAKKQAQSDESNTSADGQTDGGDAQDGSAE